MLCPTKLPCVCLLLSLSDSWGFACLKFTHSYKLYLWDSFLSSFLALFRLSHSASHDAWAAWSSVCWKVDGYLQRAGKGLSVTDHNLGMTRAFCKACHLGHSQCHDHQHLKFWQDVHKGTLGEDLQSSSWERVRQGPCLL